MRTIHIGCLFMEVKMVKEAALKSIVISICFLGTIVLPAVQTPQKEHDPLYYDVQVNAQVVPIYAVDAKGNPVYDLKEEEITLYINSKPFPLLGFTSYRVVSKKKSVAKQETGDDINTDTETTVPEDVSEVQPPASNTPERINFIILDGVSNSKSGIRNARRLAVNLVKSSGPGDAFIILKATASRGLQYVIGPEKDKAKLLGELDKVYLDPSWILLIPARAVGRASAFDHSPADTVNKAANNELPGMLSSMAVREMSNVRMEYRSAVLRFSKSLEDLKYALKTIRLPKAVFLVSGAVQDIAGDMNYYAQDNMHIQYYYESMKKAAVAINKGGSLLYMVNPIPETYKIKRAVNIMSKISNAKCINAADVDSVLQQVKNNTAAYYEAAFSVTSQLGENFRIKIKCKRKGVTLNTLEYGEKARPYLQMEDVQKELFALNVVTGGSWSRMVGSVKNTACHTIDESQKKKNTIKKVKVNLPRDFQDRPVDIFILNLDPVSLKTDFQTEQRTITGQEYLELEVEAQKDREQHVVIVEPEKTSCLFTRVR